MVDAAGWPCFFCNSASSAVAGNSVFTVGTPVGRMAALDRSTGTMDWVAPVGDVTHYQSVSAANGVVYTFDGTALHAYDASSGSSLLALPLEDAAVAQSIAARLGQTATNPDQLTAGSSDEVIASDLGVSSSGVTIARHTVYATDLPEIVALRLPTPASAPWLPDPPDLG